MVNRFTVLICILSVLVGGCKKKSKPIEEEPTPVLTPNVTPAPSLLMNIPADADGVFFASFIYHKFPSTYVTVLGNASAFIYASPTNHTYIDGGPVKVNDSILPRITGGSYYLYGTPVDGQNFSGINFQDSVKWRMAGNTTTGVPSFSFSSPGMPNPVVLSSKPNASRTHPFDANFFNFLGADSLVIILNADSAGVKKTVEGATTLVHFTTAEMAGIRKKVSFVQGSLSVIAYKSRLYTVGTKNYYFINSFTSTSVIFVGD